MKKNTIYGWQPDLPDHRDVLFSPAGGANPPAMDLRHLCPPVYDQGQLGSCTANAIGAAMQFEMMKQKIAEFTPSRLFIYWNERQIEGTVESDSGAQIRDGIKSVAQQGVCPEVSWPYLTWKFKDRPSSDCYTSALKDRAVKYQRVTRNVGKMYACLASGYPFVFGFSVYESFESPEVARSGRVPMPGPHEQCLGGHAVMAVGYDMAKEYFIVRNSWGEKWGMAGYFTLPVDYLLNAGLSDDFWTIRLI